MKVVVPTEIRPGERRVALVPDACSKLVKAGLEVIVQAGAGTKAGFSDADYLQTGARIEASADTCLSQADVVLKIDRPGQAEGGRYEVEMMRPGAVLIALLDPLTELDLVRKMADQGITAVSMELVPRITRAQSMDALSSMANIAGYKAVLLAAETLPKMFPMMMTAAGTISPARVFVIGAGVAGLQAIATARRLGAVVSGYDIRPAVREQVESLGGKFVELQLETTAAEDKGGYAKEMGEEFLRRQREMMGRVVAASDAVITTAAIPGKKSPTLITAQMVRGMRPGSVIVDLAAERGGNCELTRLDETVVDGGVTIMGPGNLPATVPYHASQTYSRNVSTLLLHLVKDGALHLDMNDEITAGCVVTQNGQVAHPQIRFLLGLGPSADEAPQAAGAKTNEAKQQAERSGR